MIYSIRFTRPALRDLLEIDTYLRNTAGNAIADGFNDEIIAKAASLRSKPSRQRAHRVDGRVARSPCR